MRFRRMHGCRNEYVCIDCRCEPGGIADPAAAAVRISDRRIGFGSDGIILIHSSSADGPAGVPSVDAAGHSSRGDVRMEIYNADGSRARMCGNGIRCVGKFVLEDDPAAGRRIAGPLAADELIGRLRGADDAACRREVGLALVDAIEGFGDLVRVGNEPTTIRCLEVETDVGVRRVYGFDRRGTVGLVTADIGPVTLRLAEMGTAAPAVDGDFVIDREIEIGGKTHTLTCVYTGNLHAVIFVDEIEEIPLALYGCAIERASIFPDRVNVHFAEVASRESLRMRPWERGSGPTQACGTGACATVAAAMATDRTGPRCRVQQPGGTVLVHALSGSMLLTGPAETCQCGQWPHPAIPH